MKRTIKASLGFLRYSPAEKATFGDNVQQCLTSNTTLFPNSPVTAAILKIVNDSLLNAGGNAKSKAVAAKGRLTNVEKDWNKAFKKVANYVSAVAEGDEEIIAKSGYKPTKGDATPVVKNDVVTDFSVSTKKGSKGSFVAGCKPQKHTNAFVFIATDEGVVVSQNGDTVEIVVGDKKARIKVDAHRETTFDNIENKKTVNVTMYSVNTAGSSPAAAPQEITVQ